MQENFLTERVVGLRIREKNWNFFSPCQSIKISKKIFFLYNLRGKSTPNFFLS